MAKSELELELERLRLSSNWSMSEFMYLITGIHKIPQTHVLRGDPFQQRKINIYGAILRATRSFFDVDGGIVAVIRDGKKIDWFYTKESLLSWYALHKNYIVEILNINGQEIFQEAFLDKLSPINSKANAKPPQAPSSQDAESFIMGLRIWNDNNVEIIIRQPGKKAAIYTPSTVGFSDPNTDEWKALLGILQSGELCYSKADKAKKQMYLRIEKKLSDFLIAQFRLKVERLKIFKSVDGQTGVRRPIFQVLAGQSEAGVDIDYSGYDQQEILAEIKKLILSSDIESADILHKAYEHAKSIGISDDDIGGVLSTDDLLPSETDDMDPVDSTIKAQDRKDIVGKQTRRPKNPDDVDP